MTYLDNAATGFPKPLEVYSALSKAAYELGGNPSRSGHIMSSQSGAAVYECREAVAELFSAKPENVVFTLNATHALNTAIKGIAKEKSHFIISNMEHNAVLRPIVKLCDEKGCSYDVVDVLNRKSFEILSDIRQKVRSNTCAVVMNHASNLCSSRIPVSHIGGICESLKIPFILDASQSAGHADISLSRDKINFLCAPAHKGLYGIMGTGFLISDGKYSLSTLTEGGSGFNSTDPHMPSALPEHLEAGTLPVPAIAALMAGCKFISSIGINEIARHDEMLFSDLYYKLSEIKGIKIYRPDLHGACFLFNINNVRSDTVGEFLSDSGICVRSGFHCAPLAHTSLKTGEYGAVRVSFGIFNTKEDNDALYFAIKDMMRDNAFLKGNAYEKE